VSENQINAFYQDSLKIICIAPIPYELPNLKKPANENVFFITYMIYMKDVENCIKSFP